jgi:hypothetical protein
MYVCMFVRTYVVLLGIVFGDIGVDGRIILKEVEGLGCVWTKFMWFWVRTHSGMF